jgi:hypothetical protein
MSLASGKLLVSEFTAQGVAVTLTATALEGGRR